MATWKLSNKEKKRVEEHSLYVKGDITIKNIQCYRWGAWTCESDVRPDIDLNNENGIDIYNTEYEWVLVEMEDGCWSDWDWGSLTDACEQERIAALFDEHSADGLEQDGWGHFDTELWIFDELALDEVDE